MSHISYIDKIYNSQLSDTVNKFGRNINVVYGSTVNCSSCSYDPINKESTNSFCSTCDGKFFFYIENSKSIKGAFKSFIGDIKFTDYALHRFGFVPNHDSRITAMLSDVLIDTDSSTGSSYLDKDKNIRVEVDNKKYKINGTFRTGVEALSVVVTTLDEIK